MRLAPPVIGCVAVCVAALVGLPAGPARAQAPQPPAVERTPADFEALHNGMLEVRQLERSGDRAGAIARAKKLLEQFPGERTVEDALLGLYRAEHRDDAVAAILRARVKRNPQDLDSIRELVSMLLARNAVDEAKNLLDAFIAGNPKDEHRYRLAATFFASRGQPEMAARFYRQGRQAIGVEWLFAAELSQIERQRGDLSAALSELMLLAEDPDRRVRAEREIEDLVDDATNRDAMIERIETMRHKHPKSAAMHDIAATAYLRFGRYPQAIEAVRAADALAGDQGEHLLDFGRTALGTNGGESVDLDRARAGLDVLQMLPVRHPDSNLLPESTRLAAEGLVRVARDMPDSDLRRKMLQDAVHGIDVAAGKLHSPDLENQNLALKGMILLEDLGRPQEALPVFEELGKRQRDLDQPDALIQVQIALCHAALGQLEEARTVLQEVVRTDSANAAAPPRPGTRRPQQPSDVGWSRARYHLAELDVISGHYDEAKTTFAALAEEAPEDRLANDCLDLALLLNEMGPGDEAALKAYGTSRQARLLHDRNGIKTALESIARNQSESPLAPVALFEWARELEEEHDTAQAMARYDEIVTKYKTHRLAPRALEATGDLQMHRLHQQAAALATYERVLTEYPDDLFLDGVRKKIQAARGEKGDERATP